ncbi:hypothetical protein NQ314_017780 [Rhamnusium bicolor]|uniref:Uncharacterized protein n=1 Tax=Rhamnusium bicolor TaxID=1586634 RepID=A0AAV8WSI8_9CUCU|nr:hypothetical protein NQ314_017780 [Rhamnusium bicolor]
MRDYISKLKYINGVDPYTLKVGDLTGSLEEILKISKSIVIDYLLFQTSPVANNEIKACKGLDALAQLACKWIE